MYQRHRLKIVFAASLLLCFFFFGKTIHYGFFDLDDSAHFQANPWLNLSNTWRFWVEPFQNLYIPLTYTLWSLIKTASSLFGFGPQGNGLDPRVFHVFSLLFHATNGWLVYRILHVLKFKDIAALLGAALFLIHPFQVQTVSWLACQRDLFAYFFALYGIFQIILHAEHPEKTKTRMWDLGDQTWPVPVSPHYLLGTGAFLCAALCKPNAVVAPVIAVVILKLVYQRPWKNLLTLSEPWIAIGVLFTVATKTIQDSDAALSSLSYFARVRVAADSIAFYVIKTVSPLWLTLDYGRSPFKVITQGTTYLSLFLIPLSLYFLAKKENLRRFLLPTLIFVLAILPVSGIMPFLYQKFSTVSDRYMYLSLLGVSLLVAELLTRPLPKVGEQATVFVVMGFLGLFAVISAQESKVWADSAEVYRKSVEQNPKTLLATNNLGTMLMFRQNFNGAVKAYKLAIEAAKDARQDTSPMARNLLQALVKARQYPEAITLFVDPNDTKLTPADKWNALGLFAYQQRWYFEAEEIFSAAHRGDPKSTRYLNNLALAKSAQGKYADAEQAFKQSIKLDAKDPSTFHNYGDVLLRQQKKKEAFAAFSKAAALKPDLPYPLAGMADILSSEGKNKEAKKYYEKTLKLAPDHATARWHLAALLEMEDQNDKAISLLEDGLKLDPRNAMLHWVIGQILLKTQKPERGTNHLRTAANLDPQLIAQQLKLRDQQRQLQQRTPKPNDATPPTKQAG